MSFSTVGMLEQRQLPKRPGDAEAEAAARESRIQQVMMDRLVQQLTTPQPVASPIYDELNKKMIGLVDRLSLPDYAESDVDLDSLRESTKEIENLARSVPDESVLDTNAIWGEMSPIAQKMMRANKIYSSIPLARNPNAALAEKIFGIRSELATEKGKDKRDSKSRQAVLKGELLKNAMESKSNVLRDVMNMKTSKFTNQANLINALSQVGEGMSKARQAELAAGGQEYTNLNNALTLMMLQKYGPRMQETDLIGKQAEAERNRAVARREGTEANVIAGGIPRKTKDYQDILALVSQLRQMDPEDAQAMVRVIQQNDPQLGPIIGAFFQEKQQKMVPSFSSEIMKPSRSYMMSPWGR